MTSLINPSNWIYLMRFHRKLMRFLRILFVRSRQKGYDVSDVNLFPPTLMRFPQKKGLISSHLYYLPLFPFHSFILIFYLFKSELILLSYNKLCSLSQSPLWFPPKEGHWSAFKTSLRLIYLIRECYALN